MGFHKFFILKGTFAIISLGCTFFLILCSIRACRYSVTLSNWCFFKFILDSNDTLWTVQQTKQLTDQLKGAVLWKTVVRLCDWQMISYFRDVFQAALRKVPGITKDSDKRWCLGLLSVTTPHLSIFLFYWVNFFCWSSQLHCSLFSIMYQSIVF